MRRRWHMEVRVKLISVLILPALLLATQPASAQTQSQLNAQAAARHRAADAALNAQYQSLLRSLSPQSRELLRQSERAWITFRDAECRLRASGVQGGSVFPMIYSECAAELIRERTRQLHDMATCEEGDLSCPR